MTLPIFTYASGFHFDENGNCIDPARTHIANPTCQTGYKHVGYGNCVHLMLQLFVKVDIKVGNCIPVIADTSLEHSLSQSEYIFDGQGKCLPNKKYNQIFQLIHLI
jgi:hypothetical protein